MGNTQIYEPTDNSRRGHVARLQYHHDIVSINDSSKEEDDKPFAFAVKFCGYNKLAECIIDFQMLPGWPEKNNLEFKIRQGGPHVPEASIKAIVNGYEEPGDLQTICDEIEQKIEAVVSAETKDDIESYLKDERLVEAARAIMDAEVILIGTGAGWSADSGLATYPDVADLEPYRKRNLDYYDLCQPHWFKSDPATGVGFWGHCADVYRTTKPHDGYKILRRWKDEVLMKNNRIEKSFKLSMAEVRGHLAAQENDVTDQPFFSLTSNVDAHWWNPNVGAVFDKKEVTEIHGNIEYWQTCNAYTQNESVWRLDPEYRFNVNETTMLAAEENFARDPKENTIARPCILMFQDFEWISSNDDGYLTWSNSVRIEKIARSNLKVVCIEIGAGMRVPSIRNKCAKFSRAFNATFIRVNPDERCLRNTGVFGGAFTAKVSEDQCKYLPFKSGGLAFLQKLDVLIKHFEKSEVQSEEPSPQQQ